MDLKIGDIVKYVDSGSHPTTNDYPYIGATARVSGIRGDDILMLNWFDPKIRRQGFYTHRFVLSENNNKEAIEILNEVLKKRVNIIDIN